MGVEENKETQRRIVEEVFNNKDMSVIPELISPDFAYDEFFGSFAGPEGFRQMCEMQNAAFPDLHYKIEDMIGEGDKLVTRMTWSGTFKGKFAGIEPTGKHIVLTEAAFSTFKDGKETGPLTIFDRLSFFQQAGIPIPNSE
jgi:steroid delta-isomerase-like uncharacterized protein